MREVSRKLVKISGKMLTIDIFIVRKKGKNQNFLIF